MAKELRHFCSGILFYMWFDEMAAQLRFNIIPDNQERLPFGCPIEIVPSQITILHDFLSSHYHDCISWEELKTENNIISELEEEAPYTLKVFISSIKKSDEKKKIA